MANDSVKSGFSFQFESTTPPEVQRNPLAGLDLSFTQPTEPSEPSPRAVQKISVSPADAQLNEKAASSDSSQELTPSSEDISTTAEQHEPLPTKASERPFPEIQGPLPDEQNLKTTSEPAVALRTSLTIKELPKTHQHAGPEVRAISFPKKKPLPLVVKPSDESVELLDKAEGPSLAAIEKLRHFKVASQTTANQLGSKKTTLSPQLEASRLKQSEQQQHPTLGLDDSATELSEPEDIYPQLRGSDYETGGSDLDESLWDSESVQPGAVLNKVKLSWNTATEQAGKWTQRGLRAGHHLKRDAVDALRQQRRNAHNKQETFVAQKQDKELPKHGVSQRILRSGLGPLSALLACGFVYLGGNGLINHTGLLSASKTVIPELGSLAMTDEAVTAAPNDQNRASKKDPIALSRYQKVSPTKEIHSKRAVARSKRFDPPMPLPTTPPPMKVESAPMPEDLSYPGKGLLEVVTSERELIYVDSVFVGRGPLRRIPLDPGEHEIRIQNNTSQRSGKIDVVATQRNRAVFAAF